MCGAEGSAIPKPETFVSFESLFERVERLEDQVKLEELQLADLTKVVQEVYLRLIGGGVHVPPELLTLTSSLRYGDPSFMSAAAAGATGHKQVKPE